MHCCLNPSCPNPHNPDGIKFCQSCGNPLVVLRSHYYPRQLLSNEGGFGRTYLAEDIDKLHEKCVIKQLAPQVQGTSALQKAKELFEQEARQLQELGEHPQIPTLYAYFEQDGYLYLVQQYIEGQPLHKCQPGTWKETQVKELLEQLLPILEFIHQRGVIHRDIKPPNIMRRKSDGKYVLIDFGASKQLKSTVVAGQGTQIGTNGYSPFEQMKRGEAYPASDLYSLGVTCFYLLTGQDPFVLFLDDGYGWVDSWRKHLLQPLSEKLQQVFDNLLQKDSQNRYQNAGNLLKDLVAQLNLPHSLQIRPQSKSPINPKSQLIAGFLLLLGMGGYGIMHFRPQPNYQRVDENLEQVSTSDTLSSGESTLALVPSESDIESVPDLVNDSDEKFSLATTLTGHSWWVRSVAISSDGETLVSGSRDKTIKIWNLKTEKLLNTLTGHDLWVRSVAISLDGQTLVSGSYDNTIKIWNLKSGKLLNSLTGHRDAIWSIAISPDGQTLVSGSQDDTIKVWNLKTGELLNSLLANSNGVAAIGISPDGNTLVSGGLDNSIKILDLETGQLLNILNGHGNEVAAIAISPDGQTLVSGSNDKTIKIWSLKTGKILHTLTGHLNPVWSVAITPDGERIASGSVDKTIKIWNLTTGELLDTLTGHTDSVESLAFTPDGRTLVSGSGGVWSANGDNSIKIWRLQ
ncbi:serine/threonine protein kinase [Laspinema sp. D1]|uniref:protein kinase domain-containing protein n=1 Tax=Laspinema palackyanum TaxID=3231601 RepID=UPI003486CC2A|nr:serine/threonine protein kinase [Laspinema sp. D2b]